MLPNLQNRLTFMDSESVDSALGSSSCSEELKVFLQSVIRRTGADQGQMYALDLSVSDSKMDAESLAKQSDRCFWFSGVQEPSKHPRAINIADLRRECLLTKARRCVIPLEKDHEPCGEIVLLFSGNVAGDPGSATLSQIAQEAVRLLDRISVREFAWKTLGLNLPLVGSSRSVQQLQIELARVSNVPYPLVLEAEFGSSDLELAAAVHCYGSRRSQPFVAIHGVFFRIDELGKQVEEVENGTLFIGSVDMLDNATQQTLLSMLRSRRESRNQPRLIVSTSVPLAQLEAEGRLCRFLRAELDVLQMRVPPLRERLEDLSSLFEYFLARHGF